MTSNIKLSTGKEIHANRGIIGISLTENEPEYLFEGYDGEIFLKSYNDKVNDYTPEYTQAELLEVAELLINRWKQFHIDVLAGKIPCR